MGPIENALKDLRHRIPREVLEEAFGVRSYGDLVSLEHRIREAVIEDRVRKDCNITGGEELNIDLSQCRLLLQDTERSVYHVPHNILRGRKIISAISVSYAIMHSPGRYSNNGTNVPLLDVAADVIDSHTPVQTSVSTDVFISAENTLMIEGLSVNRRLMHATVIVSYDDGFSGIGPRSWPTLSNMIYEAVRAYCYNSLTIIKSRKGLQGGVPLGKIEEIIEGYSDAEELYQVFVKTTWPKVALLANDRRRKNHIDQVNGIL